jgi:hypothetical protein
MLGEFLFAFPASFVLSPEFGKKNRYFCFIWENCLLAIFLIVNLIDAILSLELASHEQGFFCSSFQMLDI